MNFLYSTCGIHDGCLWKLVVTESVVSSTLTLLKPKFVVSLTNLDNSFFFPEVSSKLTFPYLWNGVEYNIDTPIFKDAYHEIRNHHLDVWRWNQDSDIYIAGYSSHKRVEFGVNQSSLNRSRLTSRSQRVTQRASSSGRFRPYPSQYAFLNFKADRVPVTTGGLNSFLDKMSSVWFPFILSQMCSI